VTVVRLLAQSLPTLHAHAGANTVAPLTVSLATKGNSRVDAIVEGPITYLVRYLPSKLRQTTSITLEGTAVMPQARAASILPRELNAA
jgi:hypothetical protein